jgi:hypothetical protein
MSIVIRILYVVLKLLMKDQNFRFGFIFSNNVVMIQAEYCYIILEEHPS